MLDGVETLAVSLIRPQTWHPQGVTLEAVACPSCCRHGNGQGEGRSRPFTPYASPHATASSRNIKPEPISDKRRISVNKRFVFTADLRLSYADSCWWLWADEWSRVLDGVETLAVSLIRPQTWHPQGVTLEAVACPSCCRHGNGQGEGRSRPFTPYASPHATASSRNIKPEPISD